MTLNPTPVRSSLLLVLAALVAVAGEAQPAFSRGDRVWPLSSGERVRVHTGHRVLVGTFVSFESDAVLVSQGGPADAFAYEDVRLLEARVSESRWRGAQKGALVGAGVATAATLGFVAFANVVGDPEGYATAFGVYGGAFVVLPGTTLIGAAIGALAPGKRWAIVPGSSATFRPVALGSGGGGTLQIRF